MLTGRPYSVAQIADMLAQRVEDLARRLLPAGRREGQEWVEASRSRGGMGDSLKVRLFGTRRGVWMHGAAGEGGDALDLVAYLATGGDKAEAIRWARGWLGVDTSRSGNPAGGPAVAPVARNSSSDPETSRRAAEAQAAAEKADREKRRKAAASIFYAAEAKLAGTPVAAYLAWRGIDLRALGRQPNSIRFHRGLWNKESGREWPGMVAAICGPNGRIVAVHRTWLEVRSGEVVRKAPLQDARRTLGTFVGGCIRLWRGASRKPLAQAPFGEHVALCEGIEDGLSVALACPELRVLSAVSIANMANLALPPAVTTVTLCADNDGDNPHARKALDKAVRRFVAEGRTVRIARSPVGKDVNDLLRSTIEEAG